ncbi:uncharacterized protein LTR77_010083 [Saxophila tyrrhenica]|uniref:Uncharacterized protein n=1 Tax=Saxophila tyrrhenica TaxID=1690608 RepID=A0AAV9NZM0_9PEZI|nr:hypothetical protein LTR77_010083 [Saxophila tyrrhenica]
MPSIFGPEDIAALIAAFPPPLPTKDQPSLVRSTSGDKLLDSRHVQQQFRSLLESENQRIKLSDLPGRLGVKDYTWLLDDELVHYSKNRSSIVPQSEIKKITEDLRERVKTEFVLLERFSSSATISYDSLYVLARPLRLITGASERHQMYAGSEALVAETDEKIKQAASGAEVEKVDLTALLPDLPSPVLLELAKRALGGADGQVVQESAGSKVAFIPATYEKLSQDKQAAEFDARAKDLLTLLETDGFYEGPSGEYSEGDQAQMWCAERYPDTSFVKVLVGDKRVVILKPSLDLALEEMKMSAAEVVKNDSAMKHRTLDTTVQEALIEKSNNSPLAELILRAEYKKQIERALQDSIQQRERSSFEQLLQTRVLAPLQLYIVGTESIKDPDLRQRIDDRVADHFRKDVLETFDQDIRERGLLKQDNRRAKDLDRTLKSRDLAKTLVELNASILAFAKKQKISQPGQGQVAGVKRAHLDQKAQAISKMTRPSDLLQNVIWILLACKSDGLFMSSGKDTSRMIKQYRLVGDGEIASKLEGWRDLLKKDECGDGEMREMRETAVTAVDDIDWEDAD